MMAAALKVLRGRSLLVFTSDLGKGEAPIAMQYEDILPFSDQLSNLSGTAIDVVLETPGGFAEVAEDMVRLLRSRFPDVAFIVPGCAKSAGTIMAMAGDDLLMEPGSSLGPIDAQLRWQGKSFSAEAFLKGLEKIKAECSSTGSLNRAYIPILQNIHPGEIQHADNALAFSQELVTQWLAQFKFRTWTSHSSTGKPVSPEERVARAKEIAKPNRSGKSGRYLRVRNWLSENGLSSVERSFPTSSRSSNSGSSTSTTASL